MTAIPSDDPWALGPIPVVTPVAAAKDRWVRPAVTTLLGATALLYLVGLGASGWANAFYSAAAQAGGQNWEAWFFGSSDAGNSITVDKPPAALWLMGLFVRIFGLSSWSILVPEALCGVASVGLLYLTVRRWAGPAAGLLAGSVLALTPVAVLMFRFNNPDALLVLLEIAAAYAVTRALETAATKWLLWAGVFIGFGFLTKMLQVLLILPALAAAYLVAAPTPVRRRMWQLLAAGGAMVVSAGWYIAVVSLIPASHRPYIGGSQHNSILELTFGYNGFGRLNGDEVGSVTGGGAGGGAAGATAGGFPGGGFAGGRGGSMWGQTGLTRLFDAENGGQISWLLPAAFLLLIALVVVTWRAPRTDRLRAATIIWGGWLLVTFLTFSLMAGIFHPYYSVALAPAVGAVVGLGGVTLWRKNNANAVRLLALTIALSAVWSFVLLGRSSGWQPWLRPLVLVVGLVTALALAAVGLWHHLRRGRWAVAVIAGGAIALLGGPAAYAVQTAATPHTGSIPSAGPTGSGGFGRGGAPGAFGGRGGAAGAFPGFGGNGGSANGGFPGAGGRTRGGTDPGGTGGSNPGGTGPGGTNPGGTGNGAFPGFPGFPGGTGGMGGGGMGGGGMGGGGMGGGGMGGLLDAGTPDPALVALLQADASSFRWAAAAVGSNNAAGLQLGSGVPVMPIGGFNGSDPSPTLAQFEQYVAEGEIHYFIGSGGFGSNGGSDVGSQIAQWVEQHFTAQTVGGQTVYDLTAPTAATPNTGSGVGSGDPTTI